MEALYYPIDLVQNNGRRGLLVDMTTYLYIIGVFEGQMCHGSDLEGHPSATALWEGTAR